MTFKPLPFYYVYRKSRGTYQTADYGHVVGMLSAVMDPRDAGRAFDKIHDGQVIDLPAAKIGRDPYVFECRICQQDENIHTYCPGCAEGRG